jgi:tetratricopeptide (TPR) repeat protein
MRLTRIMARMVTAAMLLLFGALPALAADDVDALNKQVFQLYGQGKHKEATAIAEQALGLAERVLSHEHPDALTSINNLGFLYQAQGRYGEAEPLYRRALEARERVLGREHPDTLTSVNNLAVLYFDQGDWLKAAQHWRRITVGRPAKPDGC